MSDESDQPDELPRVTELDSDAILVGAYCAKVDLNELRRYVAMDLVVAFNPLTKDTVKQAKEIETYLLGNRPNVRAVE